MITRRNSCGWLILGLAMGAGCGGEPSAGDGQDAQAVQQAYAALVGDVAACAQGVAYCARDAAGDPDALQACAEQLAACGDAASDAVADLADAARGCADDASACFPGAAGDADGVAVCRDDLAACLGIEAGGPPSDVPGAAGAAADVPAGPSAPELPEAAPVGDCIGALLGCIEAGDDVPACAQEVRGCVLDALPTPASVGAAAAGGAGEPPIPDGAGADAAPMPDGAGADAAPIPEGVPVPEPGELPAEVPADAVACLEQLAGCASDGGRPPACIAELRECTMNLSP